MLQAANSTSGIVWTGGVKKRKTHAQRTGATQRGAELIFKAYNEKPQFIETAEGDRIRVWGPNDWRHVTNEDVRSALTGKRAFEEHELLEFLPPQLVKDALSRQWLVRWGGAAGPLVVTKKARDELNLPTRGIKFADTPKKG